MILGLILKFFVWGEVMAHKEQLKFIEILSGEIYKKTDFIEVLEIGSYDVNGSIRPFFDKSHYTGVDLIEGRGVDLVADGHLLDLEENQFDLVISCESFEHNPYWKETFLNMIRMTKRGGIVAFTCATNGRPEHGTTRTTQLDSPGTIQLNWDYYKNLTEQDFTSIDGFEKSFTKYFFLVNSKSKDLYFVGLKSPDLVFDISFNYICYQYRIFYTKEWVIDILRSLRCKVINKIKFR